MSIALEDDRPLIVAFASPSSTSSEAVLHPAIQVLLNRPSPTPVTVGLWVAGGTATSGTDFTVDGQSVTFPAGATSAVVPISVIRDDVPEGAETLVFGIGGSSQVAGSVVDQNNDIDHQQGNDGCGDDRGVTIGMPDRHTLTITDDGTKIVPVITWTTTAPIIYGTVLSSTQLTATASTAGSFVYTPTLGAILSAGTQTLRVVFTPTDTTKYTSASASIALVVQPAKPELVWAAPVAIMYGTALSATQLAATSSVPGSFAYTPATGIVLNAGTQTLSVVFTPADGVNYTAATTSVALPVQKAVPTLSWTAPVAVTYGTALSSTQLSATTSTPGSFVYSPVAGTILPAGNQILSVIFTPTDAMNFTTVTGAVTWIVRKATPVLTWAAPAPITYGVALGATQLAATATTSGSFVYTPAAGTVLPAGAQNLKVDFAPADAANFTAATATVPLTVNRAIPIVTWVAPDPIVYGVALGAAQLRATTSIAGIFSYTPAAGVVLGAGAHQLGVVFTPTDAANYATATATVSLTVRQATPVLTWVAPAPIIYGTALSSTQLSAIANVAGSFVYNPIAGTVLPVGQKALRVDFTPTDVVNYTTATQTVALIVQKASPSIAWTASAPITYGTALDASQLNAVGSVPGTMTYDPAAGTVLSAGTRQLHATLTPTDTANYTTASVTVALTVQQVIPVLSWATPAPITEGTPLGVAQLSAIAAISGTFVYTPASGTVLPSGTTTLRVTFTPTDAVNYTSAATSVVLTVQTRVKETPVLTWATPAPITYGTALGATQLAAAADVPGSFVYTPAAGTLLLAGSQTLSVTFTPTDTVRYTAASAIVTLDIRKAAPLVTWAEPAAIIYGTTLSALQLAATADVKGSFAYTPTGGAVPVAGNQILSVVFVPSDAANYLSVSASVSLVVRKANPIVTWATPTAITYGTVLGANQLTAASPVSGVFAYSPAAGTTQPAGQQPLSAVFTPTDAANYTTATASVVLTVRQAAPQLIWAAPAAITYGTRLSATQLSASADVAGSFAYGHAVGALLPAGTQTLRVDFTPADKANYTTVFLTVPLVVQKAAPVLAWAVPAPITYGSPLGLVQLNATTDVAGTFIYTPTLGIVLAAGQRPLRVDFTPSDSANFTTATASVQLTVQRATPTLTWAVPAAITYGTAIDATQLAAVASVDGVMHYSPVTGTVLSAGTHHLDVLFTPTDTTNFTTASATVPFTVQRAVPTVTWTQPAVITYGTKLGIAQLSATASTAGSFLYSPIAGTMLAAGEQPLTVRFTPTDGEKFVVTTASVVLTVRKAVPVLTWATPAAITYGTSLDAIQLGATADVPGELVYTPAAGTVLPAGEQTLTAVFTPTDAANCTTAQTTVAITVHKAVPTLTWAAPAAITYGESIGAAQLAASANVSGSFAYIPVAGTILPVGNQKLQVTFTPTDGANYVPATASVFLAVNKATPVLTWPATTPITYGTALDSTQLAATAAIPGSFVYTPVAGTHLPAGDHLLSVIFSPSDSANYITSSATVAQTVLRIQPIITWQAPAGIVYGDALGAQQLNATADQPGMLTYIPAAGSVLPAGTQDLQVALSPTDALNMATATATVSVQVARAIPTITWANPVSIVYGTTLGAAQLNAVGSVPGTVSYLIPAGTLLGAGEHTLTATLEPADSVNYTTTTTTVIQVVTRAQTAVTWNDPEPIIYGTTLNSAQLNAIGSVPGQMQYQPADGTLLDTGSHALAVTFTPLDSKNFLPAQATATQVVQPATPIITWSTPAAITPATPLSSQQLNATSLVPGTFTYDPVAGTRLAAGSRELTAVLIPADQVNYHQASASVTIQVQTSQTGVTWSNPASIIYGTVLSGTQLNATAPMPGTFVYTPAAGAVLSAGTQQLSVLFLPTDSQMYPPVSARVSITVLPATPVISWATPNPTTYGNALGQQQLNATSANAGTFTYVPASGTVLPTGTHSLTVTLIPADTLDYNTVTASVMLTVQRAVPSFAWLEPAAVPYETALTHTQCNATSTIAGSFDYTPGLGTVLPAGKHTLYATFTPTDLVNYVGSGVVTTSVVVTKAQPTITWSAPSGMTYGMSLGAVQLNALGSVPGVLTYDPPAGTVLPAGDHQLSVVLTPNDVANYVGGISAQVIVHVRKAQPTLSWTQPDPIPFGTVLSGMQLHATASVDGTVAYDPPSGFALPVGDHVLSASFTPTDAGNYLTAQSHVTQRVLAGPGSLTWDTPVPIAYGTALGQTQLNAVPSVPGTLIYTPAAGTVLSAGVHTLQVTWQPTQVGSYQPVIAMVRLTVTQLQPQLAWVHPLDAPFGTVTSAIQLNATASVPGTFTYDPAAGAVLNGGENILHAYFIPDDTINYVSDLPVETTWTITPAEPVLTWEMPQDIDFGTRLSDLQLNAESTAPGSFVYNPGEGTLLYAGEHTLHAIFVPANSANYTSGQISTLLVVRRATPTIAWAKPDAYRYPDTLPSNRLNATVSTAGTLVYDPPAGTLLEPGDRVLRVTFTPTDADNYTTTTGTRRSRCCAGPLPSLGRLHRRFWRGPQLEPGN